MSYLELRKSAEKLNMAIKKTIGNENSSFVKESNLSNSHYVNVSFRDDDISFRFSDHSSKPWNNTNQIHYDFPDWKEVYFKFCKNYNLTPVPYMKKYQNNYTFIEIKNIYNPDRERRSKIIAEIKAKIGNEINERN